MARPANHHLTCDRLEERVVPADAGCAAAAEGAAAEGGEVVATGDTFIAEVPDAGTGVLGGYRVQLNEDGTVIAAAPAVEPAAAPESPEVPAGAAAAYNLGDEIGRRWQFDLAVTPPANEVMVHEETHPAGRRLSEGTLTWGGIDALLTVDPVDVVKLVMGLMGEACQAA